MVEVGGEAKESPIDLLVERIGGRHRDRPGGIDIKMTGVAGREALRGMQTGTILISGGEWTRDDL